MTLLPHSFFKNAALRQSIIIVGALLSATFMFSASTSMASAQTNAYFQAELANPVEKTTEIIRGVVWHCEGTTCTGTKDTSRPAHTCARLVKKMGNITTFIISDEAMNSDDLAKCNAAA